MKIAFVLISMLLAFSVQAADRKVGTVIGVEREIPDVYSTCLKNVSGDTSKPKSFFSCAIKYVDDGELPVTKGRAFRLTDDRCSVHGDLTNGVLFITFTGAKNPSSFEVSRGCLERSLPNNASVKAIVYTLE